MSKYAPLKQWLLGLENAVVSKPVTFEEVCHIVRSLPESAYALPQWWENNRGHVQARAWMDAGWRTENVDLKGRQLVFRRSTTL
jgi:hypothetical protein